MVSTEAAVFIALALGALCTGFLVATERAEVRVHKQNAAYISLQYERTLDALEELHAWQNGPPLESEKWLNGWGDAMEGAELVLRNGGRLK